MTTFNTSTNPASVPQQGPVGVSGRLHGRSVIEDTDLNGSEIEELFDTAARLKEMRARRERHTYLIGKTLGLVFQHPSTRTRTAFVVGMEQLGGRAIFLGLADLQVKRGETLADTAQVMSRYVNGLAVRTANHAELLDLKIGGTIPVFNALSEKCHPIEVLGDLFTLRQRFGSLQGLTFAYLGDGNNVCNSIILACASTGVHIRVATPVDYQPAADIVATARLLATQSGSTVSLTVDPFSAAEGADAVYTDVHQSMGEQDSDGKLRALAPYRVTAGIMNRARQDAVFMHCLPMRRGVEVDAEVADGPRSIIFDQAENRLHLHKALLLHTLS